MKIFKIARLMKWRVESGYIGFSNLEQQIPILDIKFEELQSFITSNLNKNTTRDAANGNDFIESGQ